MIVRKTDENSIKRFEGVYAAASAAVLAFSYVLMFLTEFFPERIGEIVSGKGSIAAGAAVIWNGICDRLGSAAYILIGKVAVPGAGASGVWILLMFILFFCLAYLTAVSGSRIIPVIWLIPPVLIYLVSGIAPAVYAVIVFAFAMAVLYVFVLMGKEMQVGHFALPLASAALILVLLASYSAAFGGFPDPAKGVRTAAASRIAALTDKESDENGTALTVTVDMAEPMYLRGVVGEEFTDGTWQAFSDEEAYDALDELYWVRSSGLDPETQYAALTKALRASEASGTITITVKDADRKIVYTPYGLISQDISGAVSKCGSQLRMKRFAGSKTYSYTADAGSYGGWTDEASKLFSAEPTEDINKYLDAEALYAGFVYGHYLEVPDSERAKYTETLGTGAEMVERHEGYREAVEQVRTAIAGFASDDKASAADAVSMFRILGIPARYVEGYIVTESDIGEAGAAAAETAGNAEPVTINVKNGSRHAWPEIYVDGYGWVPLEVSPEYIGVMPEANLGIGFEGIDTRASLAPATENTDTKPSESTAHAAGGLRAASILVFILAALVILALILYRPFVRLKKALSARSTRRKLFGSPDPRTAVSAMYGYAMQRGAVLSRQAIEAGRRAAYSMHPVTEEDRDLMAIELKNGLRIARKTAGDQKRAAGETARAQKRAGLKAGAAAKATAVLLIVAVILTSFGCSAKQGASGRADATFVSTCAETLMDSGYDKAWTAITLLGMIRADDFVNGSDTYNKALAYADSAAKETMDAAVTGAMDDADGYTQYSKALILLSASADTDERKTATDDAIAVLAEKLDEYDAVRTDGLNSEIFALISSKYAGIELGNAGKYEADIIASMTESGAVSPNGINEDIDLTAMAAQALAGTPEADKMLAWLASLQNATGAYETCESTAQTVIACAMNERNPAKDAEFKKENTLMEGLLTFTTKDGFCHTYDTIHDESNVTDLMSTQQALLAHCAAELMEDGKYIYKR